MAALKIYIDESGSSRVFVLAGYVGTLQAWDDFDIRWRKALTDAKHFEPDPLPDGTIVLRPFHMTDFDNPENTYYKRWSRDAKVALISELIDTINGAAQCAFICTLPMDIYEETIPPGVRHGKTFTYMACLKQFFMMTLTLAGVPNLERTPLIFDRNSEVSGMAMPVLQTALEADPNIDKVLGPVIYESKAQFLPLQAADILAHEVMKNRDNKALRNGKTRKSYDRLDKSHYITYEFDRDKLQHLKEELAATFIQTGSLKVEQGVIDYLKQKKLL